MSPRFLIFSFAQVFLLAVIFLILSPQRAAGGDARKGPSPPAAQPGGNTGLLLLRNGSVIEGIVRRVEGGYAVRVPNGEITVPESQIDAVCHTLHEAYEHRRGRLPMGDTKAHLELALWCLRYQLLAEAEAEIQAAAALSPNHPMLPLLRRRLEIVRQQTGQQAGLASNKRQEEPSRRTNNSFPHTQTGRPDEDNQVRPASFEFAPSAADPVSDPRGLAPSGVWPNQSSAPVGTNVVAVAAPSSPNRQLPEGQGFGPLPFEFEPARPLNPGFSENPRFRQQQLEQLLRGMPPGSIQQFTQSVQPIITHYCGTARCHGGAQAQGFQWVRPPGGTQPPRQTTQENLLATLRLINWDEPGASPLLRVPLQPHGGMPTPVFPGPQSPQYQALVSWVLTVAAASPEPAARLPLPADRNAVAPASPLARGLPRKHDEEPANYTPGSVLGGGEELPGELPEDEEKGSLEIGEAFIPGSSPASHWLPRFTPNGLARQQVGQASPEPEADRVVRGAISGSQISRVDSEDYVVNDRLLSFPEQSLRQPQADRNPLADFAPNAGGAQLPPGWRNESPPGRDHHSIGVAEQHVSRGPVFRHVADSSGSELEDDRPKPPGDAAVAGRIPPGPSPVASQPAAPPTPASAGNVAEAGPPVAQESAREKSPRWFLPWKMRLPELFR